jgi:hypothetical protein
MSNLITYDSRPDLESIQISNGLTSVFVSVLSLAASAHATNDRERLWAVWFAAHDQGIFGRGIVGFDLSEMPWTLETFDADQQFLLRVIEAAKTRSGWERLDYEPHEEWVIPCLEQFRKLLEAFQPEHRCLDADKIWPFVPAPPILERCPVHQVYQHALGCVICNDG